MDFSFFESLSDDEARKYLEDFLYFGQNRGMEIIGGILHFTAEIDFDLETLPQVLRTVLASVTTTPREPDSKLPEFIRKTESYQKNLFDFDEMSKSSVLAAAYYFGETFVKNFEKLSWAIGNPKFAQKNMPVVSGFKSAIELAPILVVENMFGGIISGMHDDLAIDKTIKTWVSLV